MRSYMLIIIIIFLSAFSIARINAAIPNNINAAIMPNGDTPLHLAARNLNLGMVQILCDAGADVNTVNTRGLTPLMCCFLIDRTNCILPDTQLKKVEKIVKYLVEQRKANLNAVSTYGYSALDLADEIAFEYNFKFTFNPFDAFNWNAVRYLENQGANRNQNHNDLYLKHTCTCSPTDDEICTCKFAHYEHHDFTGYLPAD